MIIYDLGTAGLLTDPALFNSFFTIIFLSA